VSKFLKYRKFLKSLNFELIFVYMWFE